MGDLWYRDNQLSQDHASVLSTCSGQEAFPPKLSSVEDLNYLKYLASMYIFECQSIYPKTLVSIPLVNVDRKPLTSNVGVVQP